jgi:hypothetical protein
MADVYLVKSFHDDGSWGEASETILGVYASHEKAIEALRRKDFVMGAPDAPVSKKRSFKFRKDRYHRFTCFDDQGYALSRDEAWVEAWEIQE